MSAISGSGNIDVAVISGLNVVRQAIVVEASTFDITDEERVGQAGVRLIKT